MDYQKLFDQVRNQFRVTFLCYGDHGRAFTNWLRETDQHYGGYILWPGKVREGRCVSQLFASVPDNWANHAVIIDPEDNSKARDTILSMAYCAPNIQVVTGKESNDN